MEEKKTCNDCTKMRRVERGKNNLNNFKMAKARKKPVEIEFITFDEFVEYGHKFIEENPTEVWLTLAF